MTHEIDPKKGSQTWKVGQIPKDQFTEEQIEVEGTNFNGTDVLAEPFKKKPVKFKDIKAIVIDKFIYLVDKAGLALSIGTTLVDQGRAVNEIAKAFFEPCKVLDKILTPLRFLSWTGAPFVAMSFVGNGIDFFTTPSFGKILPVMKSIVDVGVMTEMAASAAFLLKEVGVVAAQNVGVWAIPLSGVAIGLQSLAIVINGWGLAEVSNSLIKLKKVLKENTPEGYAKAVDLLTKKPETKLERFRAKFFKVLSPKQEARIIQIHKKYTEGKLTEKDMHKTMSIVKHRFHLKQFGYSLAIIASVTGIIGVAVLLFAPTPVAPIGWLFIGMAATTSLTIVGLNIFANKYVNYKLKKIDPELLPDEKPPVYKRSYTWIRKKLKKKQDGTLEINVT